VGEGIGELDYCDELSGINRWENHETGCKPFNGSWSCDIICKNNVI
jgi:hypothetical protein